MPMGQKASIVEMKNASKQFKNIKNQLENMADYLLK